MEVTIIIAIAGVIIGVVAGYWLGHNRKKSEIALMNEDTEQKIKTINAMKDELMSRERELHLSELSSLKEGYDKQISSLKEQVVSERAYAVKMIGDANDAVKAEKAHSASLREESDRQWAQKLDTLKQEMQKNAAEQLAAKQSALQENNRLQMDELLKPIKEQFSEFKKSVEESKTQNEVNKKELQSSFEATMKLFQQEQQQTVSSLKEQTQRIGLDASNLTKALKGENKTQGDWGEMILQKLLENSGLTKDEEYFVQENVKDEDGANFRPDVVVRFPEGRSIVIDSKVSLTSYAEAVEAEDDVMRDRLLKEHARSVRKHVDELADKKYDKMVSDAIGFVLMFIPNESSYIAAMRQQPDLSRYAYQKHIIIISPSNLLMALQLAYNLWQYDRQNKNVEEIVKKAADLYDKVAGFSDTFSELEGQIEKLNKSFGKAKDQLYQGRGNVMRRVEDLKSLGVSPKKQIKDIADLQEIPGME
ncbi:MAG: DNA recombination protein RmuC [Bacteroidales bacterium]|nr:DNA recombination protein RmuC [Bacteroidales bacterium]